MSKNPKLPVDDQILENKLRIRGPVKIETLESEGFIDWNETLKCYDLVSFEDSRVMGRFEVNPPKGSFVMEYETDYGPYYMHSSLGTPETAIPVIYKNEGVQYNFVTAQAICLEVMKGRGLSELAREEGMPSLVRISNWRQQHEDFDRMLEIAYEVRGEVTRDEVARIAMGLENLALSEFDLKVQGKKTDLLKWLAGQDNARYSPKTEVKHSGSVGAIMVETGVRRGNEDDKEDYSIVDVTPEKDVE